jgi:hypothetical protein
LFRESLADWGRQPGIVLVGAIGEAKLHFLFLGVLLRAAARRSSAEIAAAAVS